jgi:hypothetical protein
MTDFFAFCLFVFCAIICWNVLLSMISGLSRAIQGKHDDNT